MKSQRKVSKGYAELLKEVEENEYYNIDLNSRVNCYTCSSCGHITKTKDIDPGVTPFMHKCEKCSGMSRSSFYNDIAPEKNPTQEWYRPTLKQCLKLRKNEDLLDHILQGGLISRKITQ